MQKQFATPRQYQGADEGGDVMAITRYLTVTLTSDCHALVCDIDDAVIANSHLGARGLGESLFVQ